MKKQWLRIAFFNLFLVASIGVILRYKIAFSLPFIDQKHLLHGHSHFAFSGWITHVLYLLLVHQMSFLKQTNVFKEYRFLVIANLVTAYGMLLSFPIQGYGSYSIGFSTLSIIISYAFAIKYWKDLKRYAPAHASTWSMQFALLANAISSLGTFALAWMMATKNLHQNWYLASIYFFLHFQYNGWFFFAILGLLFVQLEKISQLVGPLKQIFLLFAIACIPAYFLSALWLPIPTWIYLLVVAAALMQTAGMVRLFSSIYSNRSRILTMILPETKWFWLLAGLAFGIKICLQLGSTIPSLSQLAFGFRPIVIGYLHLVLLGFVSTFLITYCWNTLIENPSRQLKNAIGIFVLGIIINEMVLMVQGIAALNYWSIPMIDLGLLIAALIMFTGIAYTNLCMGKLDTKA
jgi:hypothetical protein